MKISVNGPKIASYELLICGAGPAGLMAALCAARLGLKVLLLEKGPLCARKLRLSGGGRGNFSHRATREELGSAYFEKEAARFLRPAFSALDADALVDFFAKNGLPAVVENDGRIFPRSNSADEIADTLLRLCLEAHVRVQTGSPVQSALYDEELRLFRLDFSDSSVLSGSVYGQALVLACGGASFQQTGSNGDGYRLAAALGHSVTPIRPALQALNLLEKGWAELSGLSLPFIELRLFDDKGLRAAQKGALLFTHHGLSGPAALNLSRWLDEEKSLRLELNLLPSLRADEAEAELLVYARTHPRRSVRRFLSEQLPSALADFIVRRLWGRQTFAISCAELRKTERRRLLQMLQAWPLQLGSALPLNSAMVCRGGVNLSELRPQTLESRLYEGLYFAGEMLDIDGQSGGYNLQAAFSTGLLAGRSAAQKLKV